MSADLPPLQPLPPIAPPQLNYATPDAGRSDLRAIAVRQRAIMYCILGYILMIALVFMLPAELKLLGVLGALAVIVTGAVFAFMLSMAIYSTGTGIVMGIFTLVPYLELIFLLIINGRATKILRQHRIHVGLLGANLSQIPDPGQIRV